MASNITLSAATRQNLLSLQDTAALNATTQNHLSTGKKVNSALDNPVNYFTAQSLNGRSGDLSALLDGISNGIQTIQAANQGITSIQKLIDSAKSTANQALSTQITTSGSATNKPPAAFLTSGGTVNLLVNGTATPATIPAGATISQAVAALNTAVGSAAFSSDTTGTKLVLNAAADVEFAAPVDQTNLGFTAGTAGAGPVYGAAPGTATAGKSPDINVAGVTTRAALAEQYNSLLIQIDQLARDASFNGVNLLSSDAPTNKLHISFNERDTSNVDVQGVDSTSGGLKLDPVTAISGTNVGAGNFLLDADIKTTSISLRQASDTLRSQASTFGSTLSVVQNRQDFSKRIINVLDTGASNLTDADLNEEAANSQALTTRQSLGISALSLANQAQQGILQLLR